MKKRVYIYALIGMRMKLEFSTVGKRLNQQYPYQRKQK